MNEINFLTLLIGGVIGGLGTIFVRTVTIRVEDFWKRYEVLCSDIRSAADLASEYWIKVGSDPDIPNLEAQILGHQWRIDLGLDLLAQRKLWISLYTENEMFAFQDALSGGSFQVKGRANDNGRAVDVQRAAAELIVRLHSARQSTIR